MKDKLVIKGGTPLEGEIKAAGAKNAITKLLVASLISDKRCIFYNVPDIQDVEITAKLCQEIGSEINWDRDKGILEIITKELKSSYIPQRFSGANRIPILMIGALLGRTQEDIIVPTVGGCNIGARPIDFHIEALKLMGASIDYRQMHHEGAYLARAHDGMHGTLIELPFPSVGATENVILASIRAKGTTIIKNAAIEPEIVDLILFLQKLGAIINMDVNRTIYIHGAQRFYEVKHNVIPDRIEAASFAMAAIATKGRVFIRDLHHPHMITFLNKIRSVGGGFDVRNDGIEFFYDGPLRGGIQLETDVHPGFATDWQQPFVVLLSQATGASVIHETVYENRFGYTQTLKEMGADIELFKQCLGSKLCRYSHQNHYHSLIVKGPTPLFAKDITIPDLRAGFAYVMAALLAEGTSTIRGTCFIDRGYEHLVEKLSCLGADIQRIKPDELITKGCKEANLIKKEPVLV